MTHRTHRSFKAAKPKRITNWANHYRKVAEHAERSPAENQSRPVPTGKPPLKYDEYFDLQVARIKARQAEIEGTEGDDDGGEAA